jgi:hypothetical protein
MSQRQEEVEEAQDRYMLIGKVICTYRLKSLRFTTMLIILVTFKKGRLNLAGNLLPKLRILERKFWPIFGKFFKSIFIKNFQKTKKKCAGAKFSRYFIFRAFLLSQNGDFQRDKT